MRKIAATRKTMPMTARERPIFVLISMPEWVVGLEVGSVFGWLSRAEGLGVEVVEGRGEEEVRKDEWVLRMLAVSTAGGM